MTKRVKAALIGSGQISGIYLKNMTQVFNNIIDIVGCSDLIPERAALRSKEYGIKVLTNEEIFSDPEIEMVINTTYMRAHYAVTKEALERGKHVWTEKCLGLERSLAMELKELADQKGLLLGGAPDTYMGAGTQTAIKLLDAGMAGDPIAARAVLIRGYGPDKEAVEDMPGPFMEPMMAKGAGILHDVGVYYIINMIAMFGPVKRVAGFTQNTIGEGSYLNPANPKFGQTFRNDSPDINTATIEFKNGTLATLVCTSKGAEGELPILEIYGTEAKIVCGDCNMYWGPVSIQRETGEWNTGSLTVQFTHSFIEDTRGMGAADFAYAIRNGRKPRGSSELILHTLDVLDGIVESAASGKYYYPVSTCERPKPLRSGFKLHNEVFDD